MPAVFPLVVVIISGIAYHLAQKSSSGAARPWPMLAVAYGAAFALALVLALREPGRMPLGRERAAGLLIGLAAFGIEAGFFFIYRSGWPLASASVIAGAVSTVILALVGIFAYGEPVTASRAAGLAMAVTGSALIARGGP